MPGLYQIERHLCTFFPSEGDDIRAVDAGHPRYLMQEGMDPLRIGPHVAHARAGNGADIDPAPPGHGDDADDDIILKPEPEGRRRCFDAPIAFVRRDDLPAHVLSRAERRLKSRGL